MLWEQAPVVSVIHLFLTPVADKLMKLGCQGVTRVTHARKFHLKFMLVVIQESNHRQQKDVEDA